MTPVRQIGVSVVVLLAAAAGWFAWDRLSNQAGEAVTASAPPGAGGPPGDRPGRPGGGEGQAGPGQRTFGQGQGPGQGPGAGPGNRPGGGNAPGGGPPGNRGFGGPAQVVVAPVVIDATGIDVSAVGTVAASRAITLYPTVTGVVTEVAFTPGTAVTAGQVLVKLDDADQQVAVERAQVGVDTATAARDRVERLAKSANATQVDLASAATAVQNAEIDLRAARLELDKRTIRAPFAGTIGLTDVTVGDLINSQKAIATLDDMATVTVAFQVPERASGLVAIGQDVAAMTDALAGRQFAGKVTAVDSRVDPTSRTLKVEASVPNPGNALKPGMALTVNLQFAGEPHPSVSSLSIQWDRQGSYVWKIDGETAHRVPVQIIARHSGVVTVAGDLKEGDLIVTEGVLRLREGAAVGIAGAPSERPADGGGPGAPKS